MSRWTGVGIATALGALLVAIAVLLAARDPAEVATPAAPAPKAKSRAELIAANYRVLTPAQSRRLLRFAEAFASCIAARGIDIGEPEPRDTKIVMRVPAGTDPKRAVDEGVRCGEKLGDPPPGASLITRRRTIELYLPKQCLLDEKVVAG
jgi:hypothetical protein